MFGLGGIISGTIGGLYSIASGIMNRSKANQLEKQSSRPVYMAPGEIGQNQKMAELDATHGMGGAQYNSALNGINRNSAAGLAALAQQRNSLAGVGNIVSQANDAQLALDAQDDAVQRQNRGALYEANSQAAQYKDKAFQYNKADKYAQEQNMISQLRGAGNQNVGNGINSLTNLGMSYFLGKDKGYN